MTMPPPGQALRQGLLTTLAMLAFAGNSLLCRIALGQAGMDAPSFTAIRLGSGAIMLWLLLRLRSGGAAGRGNWPSALALFAYAAAFSFAYEHLTAATGALVLFPVVQATMIGHGLWRGERLRVLQWAGLAIALAGLVALLLPGVSAPPLHGALLMALAGLAWGVYSLRGRGAGDPTAVTAGNFLRATVPAVLLLGVGARHVELDPVGIAAAIASGALASALGYVIWYAVVPRLAAAQAASVQLGVPVLVALGGVVLLGEPLGLRVVVAALAILGGIALVLRAPSVPNR
jgi:drug/metabolite transporter (DMT)-like permease